MAEEALRKAMAEEALRKAEKLKDENLKAALRRASDSPSPSENTRFQLPLLQLPEAGDKDQGATTLLRSADRKVMCPEMYRAAFSGSAKQVQDLLAPTATTTATDEHKRRHQGQCSMDEITAGWNTVLHLAAGEGHALLVQQLFQDTAAAAVLLLPSENSRGETALHRAARAGYGDVVSLLIRQAQAPEGPGAPHLLLRKNHGGDTALHVAARRGRQAVVQVLMVAAPALSGAVNNAGMSPLYLAVTSRSIDTVKALIYRDLASASAPTYWDHTSASGPKMQTALHAAVLQCKDITSEILSWKPDLAKQGDELGSTPLHYAASDGDRSIVRLLIERTPLAAYEQDKQGFTPLHLAAWMGHVQVISDILEACPDAAELVDKKGRNFLHVAVERGHESVVRYVAANPLLTGMVNEQDKDGNTPLHSAIIAGNPNLAILDSRIVELNIADNQGRMPFDLASKISSFLYMIVAVLKLSANGGRFGKLRQGDITPWRSKQSTAAADDASQNTKNGRESSQDPSQNTKNGTESSQGPSQNAKNDTESSTTTDTSTGAQDARRSNADQKNHTDGAAIKDWLNKTSKNLGIVAVLIATVGLSAMFNVPGGYDSSGVANLRATVPYNTFLVLDTVAVAASVVATMLLTYGGAVRFSAVWLFLALIFLWVALMSMILAFMAAVVSGLDSTITKGVIWGIFVMPFAFLVGLSFAWPVPAPTFTSFCLLLRALARRDREHMRRNVGRRFPLLWSYFLALCLFWFLNVVAFVVTLYVIITTIS